MKCLFRLVRTRYSVWNINHGDAKLYSYVKYLSIEVSLTVKTKLEIDITSEFGIAQSTLSTIVNDQDKLCSLSVVGSSKNKSVTGNLKSMLLLFSSQSVPISGVILKAKAEELNKEFDQSYCGCLS